MKHWHLGLLAAVAAIFHHKLSAGSIRLSRHPVGLPQDLPDLRFRLGRPADPSNYRVLTPPLPSFRAAVRAKSQLTRHGRCSI